jgi:hypothetical protein
MDRLDPAVFKKMFWLERPVFDELVITPHLVQCCDSKAQNSSGSAISSKTRLGVTLRWLAGASHIDLCFAWGLAHSTFFSERGALWPTVEAIDNAFEMDFPVNDLDRLEELSKGFSDHSVVSLQLMALWCKHVAHLEMKLLHRKTINSVREALQS